MMKTKNLGNLGENIAEKYLERRGWRIISNNFSSRGGEIDLIGYRFGVLAYFEVKTRTNETFGRGLDAVDQRKIQRIRETARVFRETYGKFGKIPVFYPFGIEKMRPIKKERIDVIEIYLSREGKLRELNHIKDCGTQL